VLLLINVAWDEVAEAFTERVELRVLVRTLLLLACDDLGLAHLVRLAAVWR